MQTITSTTTTAMLVSPNKAPSKPAADRDSSSAWAGVRCNISTPPPLEDSFTLKMSPSSGSKMKRPMMMSPPPLPKRCRHFVVPSRPGRTCSFDDSTAAEQQPETPPASTKSVLIDLNEGHSILNNPKSADAPPPIRLVAPPSVSTQEPQEEGGGSSSIDTSFTSTRSNGPVLSFDASSSDDDSLDAELASYFPRIRLQMRPQRRQRRSDPRHAKFIPIQDDASEESSGELDC